MDTNILSSRALECASEQINNRWYRVFRDTSQDFDGLDVTEYLALPMGSDGDAAGCAIHSKTVKADQDPRQVSWERWPEVVEC